MSLTKTRLNKGIITILLILLTLVFFAGLTTTVVAQEDSEATETVAVEDMQEIEADAEDFLTDVLSGMFNLTYLAFAAPLVYVLTQITKRFVSVRADTISWVYTVVIWVLFVFASRAGLQEQFKELVPAFATILAGFTGVILTPRASGFVYEQVKGVPILGHSRSADPDA